MRRRLEHTDEPRTEIGHTAHLRVSIGTARPPLHTDVDVHPVLAALRSDTTWNQIRGSVSVGIDDALRACAQLIFWHSDVSPVRITNHRSLLGAGNMSSVRTGRLKAATGPVHGAFDATHDDP